MPFSLYHRLELDKLTPTEISLQMADKSTAIPVGICEDVPIVVANFHHGAVLGIPLNLNLETFLLV